MLPALDKEEKTAVVNLDYRIVSPLMKFVEKLSVPMAEVWLWALGSLFSGRLKLLTSDTSQETWPIPFRLDKRETPTVMVGSRLYPASIVSGRLGHLSRCLLDPTEKGKHCRRLFPFFLGQDWKLDCPKIGDFSLISPVDLDFFSQIKDLTLVTSFLHKIGFRPLNAGEVELERLIYLGFKYGSHLLFVEDVIRLLEVDWDERTNFSDVSIEEISVMNLDQPLVVVPVGDIVLM